MRGHSAATTTASPAASSAAKTQLTVGESIQLTATGFLFFVNEPANLTQEVVYTSSDPSVAKAENAPGDRSLIVALKPGVAVISARDPATGIATNHNATVALIVTAP